MLLPTGLVFANPGFGVAERMLSLLIAYLSAFVRLKSASSKANSSQSLSSIF